MILPFKNLLNYVKPTSKKRSLKCQPFTNISTNLFKTKVCLDEIFVEGWNFHHTDIPADSFHHIKIQLWGIKLEVFGLIIQFNLPNVSSLVPSST